MTGDNVNYYELQINPQNKVFQSQFDGYNKPKVEPQGLLRSRGLGPEDERRSS